MPKNKVKIGLLGLGTVGTGVYKILSRYPSIEIKKIGVKNLTQKREVTLPQTLLTDNLSSIVDDPSIDIVIEVIGGTDTAYDLVKRALTQGKHVITANKALLSVHGEEVFELAKQHKKIILYEAAVAGGIPIIMPIKQSLAGNNILSILGILNGTTNYILTQMYTEGWDFNTALRKAQELGYAEADPKDDIEGNDAAYKIGILSSIAFGMRVHHTQIYREGISKIRPKDLYIADELGYTVKLIAFGKKQDNNKLDIRVHPMFISKMHPLSGINGVLNAVCVTGDAVGEIMISGPGAGQMPTASSIMGDVLLLSSNLMSSDNPLPMMNCSHSSYSDIMSINETINSYYINFTCKDEPGVIGEVGTICGHCGISIKSIIQRGIHSHGQAEIVLLTHNVQEANMQKALQEIKNNPKINEITSFIRVYDI